MARIFFFALLISFNSFGQSDAGEYIGAIGEQFNKISHEMMTYTSAVNHGKSARKVEKRRTELMQQVKESETTVRKMKPFNGVSTLRDSIAGYFRMTSIVLNKDYGKIVDLEEIAEQSYDAMEAYLLAKEKAEDRLDLASDNANEQYQVFATANNIKLIKSESELSRKMEKAGKISVYTNKVYLLFFKSYKNEAYLMDAVSRDDITGIEQSRNALAASATADLGRLGEVAGFNGDMSLRTSLQQILTFYKTEANDKMKLHSDYLLAKDSFEKIKKNLDATPQGKRTKENVDAYNKAVNEFNAKVNTSNAMHQDMNKKRSAALKNWNEAYDTFLDKHTPKYK